MNHVTYADVLKLLNSGQVEISEVGALWNQVICLHLPGITAPVLSTPMTLHMCGEMDSIVYAQLLSGTGLKQAWRRADLRLAWSGRRVFHAEGLLAINSFAIPDLALYWDGEDQEKPARQLGAEFAKVLAEEYPDPVAEVLGYFDTDLETLIKLLGEVDYHRAGITLRANPDKHE
jgi:hypothetical protein